MTTMQTSQYGKSAIFKIFHTRVTPVKSITTLLSRQQCSAQNLGAKAHFYIGFGELGLIVWSVDRFGYSLELHHCFKFP